VKRAVLAPLVLVATSALAACGSTSNTAATSTGLATPGVVVGAQVRPAGAQPLTEPPALTSGATCEGRPTTNSLAPSGPLPAAGHMPVGSWMATIADRGGPGHGYLIAGVDQNTLNWGYVDPSTGQLAGFDIDMVKQVAEAIFGPDYLQHLRFVIVPNADRQQAVDSGAVDLVAETMTITCGRQEGRYTVDFSSEYYDAHQEVLVPSQSGIVSPAGLNGKRVCAADGSTSLTTVKDKEAQVQLWEAPNEPDCLVMLQQGQVDAISTDDTILDGFAVQDPNLKILTDKSGKAITLAEEPYGMAMSPGHPDLVRFVNAVLANEDPTSADGTWARIWRQDLGTRVVPLSKAQYRSS
jgi:polar amino acid transport system substrate-binding protein